MVILISCRPHSRSNFWKDLSRTFAGIIRHYRVDWPEVVVEDVWRASLPDRGFVAITWQSQALFSGILWSLPDISLAHVTRFSTLPCRHVVHCSRNWDWWSQRKERIGASSTRRGFRRAARAVTREHATWSEVDCTRTFEKSFRLYNSPLGNRRNHRSWSSLRSSMVGCDPTVVTLLSSWHGWKPRETKLTRTNSFDVSTTLCTATHWKLRGVVGEFRIGMPLLYDIPGYLTYKSLVL